MGIFSGVFGRKASTPETAAQQQQFDTEWAQALKRFGVVTGLGGINLDLKHPKTGRIMSPHDGLGQTFSEWQAVESAYDRRALIFSQIASMIGKAMNHWQAANYLSATRFPQKAFALLEKAPDSETASAPFQAALARVLINLGRKADALAHAKQATEAEPDDARLRTLYADTLHLSGRCEEAHAIYSEQQTASHPPTEGSDQIAPLFTNFFSQETGSVPSPVLALEIGESLSDPAQAEEFWRLAETEFYDSAYFRMHHAYHLSQSGETERGFAKLLSLVREMPWLAEPSLNLMEHFKALDPTGQNIMPEYQTELRQTIRENGWTTEYMNQIIG